jgi:hypothetical protein
MDPSNTDYTIVQNRTLGVIQSLLVTVVELSYICSQGNWHRIDGPRPINFPAVR